MNGVSFDELHSYRQLGMILGNPDIERPKARLSYLEIPGRDGALDLSEALGELRFEQRKITMPFKYIGTPAQAEEKISEIQNLLSGKKMKISFDRDMGFYFYGRLLVEGKAQHPISQITITAYSEPYKYKRDVTEVSFDVTGSLEVILSNDRMTTYPVVTTTNPFLITKDETTYSYGAVSNLKATIPLTYGDNMLILTGIGTVNFRYQEGSL